MLKKSFNSFLFAWRGLLITWKEERNFRIEVSVAILVTFFIFYFDFSFVESALAVLVMTMVLSAEILNTIIEDICNKIEPNQDHIIGKIKDMSGAFVFVSVIGAIVIGIMIFYNHFSA